MLELRHYRYFVAVAEERHFGRAAERLHISQPPLSQQIMAMEEMLRVRLFERSRRKVELTEAGRLLLDEARRVLAQADHAEWTVRRAATGELGSLAIGFTGSSPFNQLMPKLVKGFRDRWPEVELSLREMSTTEQLAALQERRVDIGFARPAEEVAVPGVTLRLAQRELLLVALNAGHPLAAFDQLAMAQLAGQPFVMHPRQIGAGLYDRVQSLARAAGFQPEVVVEAHQISTLVGLAAAGLGICVVPEAMRGASIPNVTFRPLTDPMAFIDLFIAHSDGPLRPAVTNFLSLVEPNAR
jgi:DNA-binding transcriptional LysR family regulator